jgi:hypothetical protein
MKNIWHARICFWESLYQQVRYMVRSRGLTQWVSSVKIVQTFKEMDYDQGQGFIPAIALVDEFLRGVEKHESIS